MTVRAMEKMIAGMAPELIEGDQVFCTTTDASLAGRCLPVALAMFRESEGTSFVLPAEDARALGFDCAAPMRRITLNVYSALDGVGLTAAVARVLLERGIPCNMVAAFHHDHVFVPADKALDALKALSLLTSQARSGVSTVPR